MKRICIIALSVVLTFACLAALFSCGDKSVLKKYEKIVREAAFRQVDCEITAGDLSARSTLKAGEGTVTYTLYNPLSISSSGTEMKTETEVPLANGSNTVDIQALNFDEGNFSALSEENGTMTATVCNPDAFFGSAVDADTAVLTITAQNDTLTSMSVSYTTKSGSAVTIRASFS